MSTCPRGFRTIQDIASVVIVNKERTRRQISSPREAAPITSESVAFDGDEERTFSALVSWISQGQRTDSHHKALPFCAEPCPNRGHIALLILNAIRDACRTFLEDLSSADTRNIADGETGNSLSIVSASERRPIAQDHEDSFPQLPIRHNQREQSYNGRYQPNPNARPNGGRGRAPQQSGPRSQRQKTMGAKDSTRRIRSPRLQTTPGNNAQTSRTIYQSPDFSSVSHQEEHQSNVTPGSSSSTLHLLEERLKKPQITGAAQITGDGHLKPVVEESCNYASQNSKTLPQETKDKGNQSNLQQGEGEIQNDHPPVTDDISSLPCLKNLVTLYNTLLEASLVPSTALELHLLLRLLTVAPQSSRRNNTDDKVFSSLFDCSGKCILFASQVLFLQARALFGLGLTQSLLSCPVVKTHCPSLIQTLLELEQQHTNSNSSVQSSRLQSPIGSAANLSNQTALFTLPFDSARDSRHNFRSVEEQALYKNRESTRDAFLNQLRNFPSSNKHIGGSPKAAPSERHMVRMVMDGISHENFPWFADVFRDFLLQLGPIPLVPETDTELRKMTDSETLQKLHHHLFSASLTQSQKPSDKSSRSIVDQSTQTSKGGMTNPHHVADSMDKSHPSSTASIHEQQLKCFPGYEQFFFIFVIAADSYQFSRHLLNSLTKTLENDIRNSFSGSSHDMDEVRQRVQRMRLLAKFIGVLLFSPFWTCSALASLLLKESYGHTSDILGWLTQSGIALKTVLDRAHQEDLLVVVVPWIVDLLRMGQWAPHITESADTPSTYRDALIQLRGIQVLLPSNMIISITNKAFLSSCIECLFSDSLGLVRTVDLELSHHGMQPVSEDVHKNGYDHWSGIVTKEMMLTADSSIAELFELTVFMSRPNATRATGKSMKLQLLKLDDDADIALSPFSSSSRTSHTAGIADEESGADYSRSSNQSLIQRKLRDTFFHQHPRVKQVCDFAIHETFTDVYEILETRYIKPMVTQKCETCTEHVVDVRKTEVELRAICRQAVRSLFCDRVRDTLKILAPSNCKQEVMKMACDLSVEEGLERSNATIHFSVVHGMSLLASETRRLAKDNPTNSSDINQQDTTHGYENEEFEALANVSREIEVLAGHLAKENTEICSTTTTTTIALVKGVSNALDSFLVLETCEIPPQSLLRRVFASIVDLDYQLQRNMAFWLFRSNDDDDEKKQILELLVGFFSLACQLTHVSQHGLPSLIMIVQDPPRFVELMSLTERLGVTNALAEVLVKLVNAKLIPISQILASLPQSRLLQEQVCLLGPSLAPEISWHKLLSTSKEGNEGNG